MVWYVASKYVMPIGTLLTSHKIKHYRHTSLASIFIYLKLAYALEWFPYTPTILAYKMWNLPKNHNTRLVCTQLNVGPYMEMKIWFSKFSEKLFKNLTSRVHEANRCKIHIPIHIPWSENRSMPECDWILKQTNLSSNISQKSRTQSKCYV